MTFYEIKLHATEEMNLSPELYKTYSGNYFEALKKLIIEGRKPLNISAVMEARLKWGDRYPNWNYNSFATNDAIAYHPDGRIKVILNARILQDDKYLFKVENFYEGQINLEHYDSNRNREQDLYTKLEGVELNRREIITNVKSPEDVKQNPLWQILSRKQDLLDGYIDYVYRIGEKRKLHNSTGCYFKPFETFLCNPKDRPTLANFGMGGLMCSDPSILYGNTFYGDFNNPTDHFAVIGKLIR